MYTYLHNMLGSREAREGWMPHGPVARQQAFCCSSCTRRGPHSHRHPSGRRRLSHPNAVCGSPYNHPPLRGRRPLWFGCETFASRSFAVRAPHRLASSTIYHQSPPLEPARCAYSAPEMAAPAPDPTIHQANPNGKPGDATETMNPFRVSSDGDGSKQPELPALRFWLLTLG